jgi:hypothetical protein
MGSQLPFPTRLDHSALDSASEPSTGWYDSQLTSTEDGVPIWRSSAMSGRSAARVGTHQRFGVLASEAGSPGMSRRGPWEARLAEEPGIQAAQSAG